MNKYKVWHIDAYSGWYDYDNQNDCNIHTDIVMDACFTANQVSSMFASQLGGRTVVIAKCECIGQGECEVPSSTEKEMEDSAEQNSNGPVFVNPAQGGANPFENAPPTEIDDHPVDEFIGEGDDRPGEGIHF